MGREIHKSVTKSLPTPEVHWHVDRIQALLETLAEYLTHPFPIDGAILENCKLKTNKINRTQTRTRGEQLRETKAPQGPPGTNPKRTKFEKTILAVQIGVVQVHIHARNKRTQTSEAPKATYSVMRIM